MRGQCSSISFGVVPAGVNSDGALRIGRMACFTSASPMLPETVYLSIQPAAFFCRAIMAHRCPWPLVRNSVNMKFSQLSEQAAWARCIAPAIPYWTAT